MRRRFLSSLVAAAAAATAACTPPAADPLPGPWVDYSPRWAPSGDRIAFVSSRVSDLEDRHLWIVSASGGDPVRVSPDGFYSSPAWSPDATAIASLRSTGTSPPEVTVQECNL